MKYDPEPTKLYLSDGGDRSVGIEPMTVTISTNLILENAEERSDFRKSAVEWFQQWSDSRCVSAFFHDECPECGHHKDNCRCQQIDDDLDVYFTLDDAMKHLKA